MSLEIEDTEDWTFKSISGDGGVQVAVNDLEEFDRDQPLKLLSVNADHSRFVVGSSSQIVVGSTSALNAALTSASDYVEDSQSIEVSKVVQIAWLANGKQFVAAFADGQIIVYDDKLNAQVRISKFRDSKVTRLVPLKHDLQFVVGISGKSGRSVWQVASTGISCVSDKTNIFALIGDNIVTDLDINAPFDNIVHLEIHDQSGGELCVAVRTRDQDHQTFIQTDGGWEEIEDACPAFGDTSRAFAWFDSVLASFPTKNKLTLISACSQSTDLLLSTNKAKLQVIDDSDKLPFTSEDEDVVVVGSALLINSNTVANPIKGIEMGENLPMWLILTQEGRVLGWYVVSKAAIKNKTTLSLSNCAKLPNLTKIDNLNEESPIKKEIKSDIIPEISPNTANLEDEILMESSDEASEEDQPNIADSAEDSAGNIDEVSIRETPAEDLHTEPEKITEQKRRKEPEENEHTDEALKEQNTNYDGESDNINDLSSNVEKLKIVEEAKAAAQRELYESAKRLEAERLAREKLLEEESQREIGRKHELEKRFTSTSCISSPSTDSNPFLDFQYAIPEDCERDNLEEPDRIFAETNAFFQFLDSNLHSFESDHEFYRILSQSKELNNQLIEVENRSKLLQDDNQDLYLQLNDLLQIIHYINSELVDLSSELNDLDAMYSQEAFKLRPLPYKAVAQKQMISKKLGKINQKLLYAKELMVILLVTHQKSNLDGANIMVAVDAIDQRLNQCARRWKLIDCKENKQISFIGDGLNKSASPYFESKADKIHTNSRETGMRDSMGLSTVQLGSKREQKRYHALQADAKLQVLMQRKPNEFTSIVNF